MKITASPLCWPEGWQRTANRKKTAPYQVSFSAAYDDALEELRKFKAFGVVISTDVPLGRQGRPYADADPRDPGVAVYFTRGKQQYVIASDLYDRVRFNMRAVGLALEGLRAVERSGATHLLDRAFSGFAALPPPASTAARPWREVLNLEGFAGPEFAMRAGIDAAYKTLARTRHPDAGGSEAAMVELNRAREDALREIGGAPAIDPFKQFKENA